MSKLFISILIGISAGIIDVIPMIMQKLDNYANLSAFVHWLVLSIIISYIQAPIPAWLKGFVIAELSSLPIIILVAKNDPLSAIPIIGMSAVLGILVGITTKKYAH